ncbi:Bgt-135 [Blumeria graminis f. sp. tritici]|uniref:Bgt-135 n=1 Tax=Blumeria graminis f. sp. tritici TaxID=62690 RepID=A0A9X9PQR7_BLUGR|nr:Bgt-135 [Blumeria graminis f. sp. tritici]
MPSVASTRARRSRPGLAAPRRLPVFTVSKAGTTTSPSPRKRLSPSSIKIVSPRKRLSPSSIKIVSPRRAIYSVTELSSTQNSSPTGTVEASKDTACSLFHA